MCIYVPKRDVYKRPIATRRRICPTDIYTYMCMYMYIYICKHVCIFDEKSLFSKETLFVAYAPVATRYRPLLQISKRDL